MPGGTLPPSLRSVGLPPSLRSVALEASGSHRRPVCRRLVRCSHHIEPVFFRRWPYADRLPDLDDVHSCFVHYCFNLRLTLEHDPYDCGVFRQRRSVPVSGHKIAYAPHRKGYYGFDHLEYRFPAGGSSSDDTLKITTCRSTYHSPMVGCVQKGEQ